MAAAFATAAELGGVDAMNRNGKIYGNGWGVTEDCATALHWSNETAWGDPLGLSNLGALYENGYGIGQDPIVDMMIFEGAARRGSAREAVARGVLRAVGDTGLSDPGLVYGWGVVGVHRANDGARCRFEEDGDHVAGPAGATGIDERKDIAGGHGEQGCEVPALRGFSGAHRRLRAANCGLTSRFRENAGHDAPRVLA